MAQPNVLTTPYLTAEGYYKRAWRDALKPRHRTWSEPLMRRNLAYLWASRTEDEQQACEQLVTDQALTLPVIDLAIMPTRSVPKGWTAHVRAMGRLGGGGGPVPVPPSRSLSPLSPDHTLASSPSPPPHPPKRNTTNFPFWPQDGDTDAPIPDDEDNADELFKAGTLLLDDDHQEDTWHGVHELGQGANGRAMLWVHIDAKGLIVDRMAIKDTRPMSRNDWISPIYWRDGVPREIAIMQRLESQKYANIHGFRGYRLNMQARRFRLYQDVCDYKDLGSALFAYYQSFGTPAAKIQRAQRLNSGEAPPDHIPERFLWYVFSNLADAFLVLKNSNGIDIEGKPWKEIVHKDLSLDNIFVTPPLHVDGTLSFAAEGESFTDDLGNDFYKAGRDKWPHIVIADFDMSFFDLQDGEDVYQDNPFHYIQGHAPMEGEDQPDGRYPPEYFHEFYAQVLEKRGVAKDDVYSGPDVRITSQADVWGIGQVMWNLILNLSQGGDYRPSFDSTTSQRDHLSDGHPYTHSDLDKDMFSGDPPYEITSKYSEELRQLVKECLAWDPVERITVEEVKERIEGVLGREEAGGEDEDGGEVVDFLVPERAWEFEIGRVFSGRKRKRGGEGDLLDYL